MSSYSAESVRMPQGFDSVLKEYVREVLRSQPDDIVKFGLEHFTAKAAAGGAPAAGSKADASSSN